MNPLDALRQSPILEALVPHLDRASARALFSSCRTLHRTLKSSASIRYKVWLLERKRWNLLIDNGVWFVMMMSDMVHANDVQAARLACAAPAQYNDDTYVSTISLVLGDAVQHEQHEMVELLLDKCRAAMSSFVASRALASGNLTMVKYLTQRFPESFETVETRLSTWSHGRDCPTMHAYQIYVDGVIRWDYPSATPGQVAVHKWLQST
jgi:hypothetical protein